MTGNVGTSLPSSFQPRYEIHENPKYHLPVLATCDQKETQSRQPLLLPFEQSPSLRKRLILVTSQGALEAHFLAHGHCPPLAFWNKKFSLIQCTQTLQTNKLREKKKACVVTQTNIHTVRSRPKPQNFLLRSAAICARKEGLLPFLPCNGLFSDWSKGAISFNFLSR